MAKRPKKQTKQQQRFETSKENRLFDNLCNITKQFMQGKGYSPLGMHELMQRLSLPDQHENMFAVVLKTLVEDKIAEVANGRYLLKQKQSDIITGVMKLHPRGFGFVKPDDATQSTEDIFIPKHLTQNAVDGDSVEVLIQTSPHSEKGPEGKVIAILKRARTHIAGVVSEVLKSGDSIAYVPALGMSQRVVIEASNAIDLKVGDRVILEVLEWGSKETVTTCRYSHYLGHISDPSCDTPAAIEEFELRADFPTKVIKEAQSFGVKVAPSELKEREDLRETECITIDPETAKDFDDALSLSKDENGHYHLGVHIADVSHYVKQGSALDLEAHQRCNSTYFPGFCLPMLPHELSSHLCSLKPLVNRLTITAFMTFDSEGEMVKYRLARTVIRSAKRFSYQEAKQVLDGKKKSKHLPLLKRMVELCLLLKKKRYERGSIEFCLPETIVKVDEKGMPTGTELIEYDVTHQLVEEFMLKANETVAQHLNNQGKGVAYRIHDVPAEENMKDFAMLAGAFGFKISDKPSPKEIQAVFDEALNSPYGPHLAAGYIKRMKLAQYSPDNIGHYGLGLTHYCHFTSPIRRYVDLIIHRSLFEQTYTRDELDLISSDCSEQERVSAKAESSVLLLKKLRLLDRFKQEEPMKQFEAVVTRVKPFGFYFDVIDLMLEGFLHVADIGDDYYIYDENNQLLKGSHKNIHFKSGEKLTVMIKDVDLIYRDSKWHYIPAKGKKAGKAEKTRTKFRKDDRRKPSKRRKK